MKSPYNGKQKEILKDRIYSRIYKNASHSNKKNSPNIKNEILDEQILDFLNKNKDEKENIIKKMKNQKINNNKIMEERKYINANNKNRIINLNNLNNYSYINNNYNYYCDNSNNTNNNFISLSMMNNANNFNNEKILIDKCQNKNKIKTIYSNKKPQSLLNINFFPKSKREPFKMNFFNNENINTANVIMENDYNCSSSRTDKNSNYFDLFDNSNTSRNKNFIDENNNTNKCSNKNINNIITSGRYNIPVPGGKISPFNNHKVNDSNTRDNEEKRKEKKINRKFHHYETDKNPLIKITLNGYKSFSKIYKNKVYKNKVNKNIINQKLNKNIIQKNLNLFFSNNNTVCGKNKHSEKVTTQNKNNIVYDNKTIVNNSNMKQKNNKTDKIQMGFNQNIINILNKNNSEDDKKIKSSQRYKVAKSVINEQFHDEKNEKKESDSLRTSVQSMNDSKIMELANKVIGDEENLDRDEIKEILNSKKEK